MNLIIESKVQDETALINISGEVDMYSSPEFRKAILSLLDQKIPKIVVDLKNVTYMDSSGVATLIEGLQLCAKYEGTLMLSSLQTNVREVFELTRLDQIFKIYDDVNTAMANL